MTGRIRRWRYSHELVSWVFRRRRLAGRRTPRQTSFKCEAARFTHWSRLARSPLYPPHTPIPDFLYDNASSRRNRIKYGNIPEGYNAPYSTKVLNRCTYALSAYISLVACVRPHTLVHAVNKPRVRLEMHSRDTPTRFFFAGEAHAFAGHSAYEACPRGHLLPRIFLPVMASPLALYGVFLL